MPAFDITTNPMKLSPLKPGEQAKIVATVTNRLGRRVTARAFASVQPDSFKTLVKPPANIERSFAQTGATEDFVFTVQVPANAAPGSFTVAIAACESALPDDNFGSSAPLTVTILPATGGGPPPPPKRWWIWVLVGLGVVAVGLLIWALVRPKPHAVSTEPENCTPTYALEGTAVGAGEILFFSGAPDARGARVYLNGKCQERMLTRGEGAILLLAKVPPGGYHVSVRKDGYQNLERDITVVAGQRVSVDFDLRR